ncbi:MAG TPA: hypothetical protein VHB97_19860, partial [Polyangia bacterium]|nr:hypothetical protein [Polyangia bacterium]
MRRALAATIALAALASTASAYVRSRTAKGVPVAWSGPCAQVTPDSAGTPDMPFDQVVNVVHQSLNNWASAVGAEGYLQLAYETPMPMEAHLDGINTIKFRTDKWCHPNDAQQNNICYSAQAAGITTVFYVQDGSAHAGTILDADIELNDINFTFAILPTTATADPNRPFADLENTLTHELGHLQGLDHTCNGATPPQETDENGNPPPICNYATNSPEIKATTMYATAQPGETSKRMPKADDVAGIVNAYPAANAPSSMCEPTD